MHEYVYTTPSLLPLSFVTKNPCFLPSSLRQCCPSLLTRVALPWCIASLAAFSVLSLYYHLYHTATCLWLAVVCDLFVNYFGLSWLVCDLVLTWLWLAFDLFVTLLLTCLWLCFWLVCDLLLLLLTSLWLAFVLFGTFLLLACCVWISWIYHIVGTTLFVFFFVCFVCLYQNTEKVKNLSLFKSDKQRPNFRGRPPFNKNRNKNNNNNNKDTVKYLRTTTTLRIILCGRFYAPCITQWLIVLMHCMNGMTPRQSPVHILMPLANIYSCILESGNLWSLTSL